MHWLPEIIWEAMLIKASFIYSAISCLSDMAPCSVMSCLIVNWSFLRPLKVLSAFQIPLGFPLFLSIVSWKKHRFACFIKFDVLHFAKVCKDQSIERFVQCAVSSRPSLSGINFKISSFIQEGWLCLYSLVFPGQMLIKNLVGKNSLEHLKYCQCLQIGRQCPKGY